MLPLHLVTGPITHAAHGQWGRASISLVLRAGLPVLGGFAGSGLADCEPPPCDFDEDVCSVGWEQAGCELDAVFGGIFLGLITAEILDVSVLAWGERELERPRFSGGLSIGSDRVNLSVRGSF